MTSNKGSPQELDKAVATKKWSVLSQELFTPLFLIERSNKLLTERNTTMVPYWNKHIYGFALLRIDKNQSLGSKTFNRAQNSPSPL